MTSFYEKASEYEKNGDLMEASRLYSKDAFESLNRNDFEIDRDFRISVTMLLLAISCDVRAENTNRVDGLIAITEGVLRYALSSSDFDDDCLRGLLHEWLGDIFLMADSGNAKEQYEAAIKIYENVPEDECLSWGMEEEFDYGLWAVKKVIKSKEYDDVADSLSPLNFVSRVETKQEIIT